MSLDEKKMEDEEDYECSELKLAMQVTYEVFLLIIVSSSLFLKNFRLSSSFFADQSTGV